MTKLHLDLLVALNGAKPHGLPLEMLLADMRGTRHRDLTLPQLQRALRDLADKALVALLDSALKQRWRITTSGVSALEDEGLD